MIENCTYLASLVEEIPQEILSISYLKFEEEKACLIRNVQHGRLPSSCIVCVRKKNVKESK